MKGMPSSALISFSSPGDVHLQLARLDHAGPGDEEERPVEADVEIRRVSSLPADRQIERCRRVGSRVPTHACAARSGGAVDEAALKSGWPSRGVEVNSGWNWQPKNHGWPGSSTISGRSLGVASWPAP